jgi:FkbM family methyltransferase
VRRYDPEKWVPGWRPHDLGTLARPTTVIDVGVGHGTPRLYEAFPDAYHVLLEPVREFEPDMQRVLQALRGEYVITAVGSKPGSTTLNLERGYELTKSSTFRREGYTEAGKQVEERTVPVRTIDGIVRERGLQPPFVIKIDTEGGELDVVRGAALTLRQTELLIAEVCVATRFTGGYTFAQFIREMDEHGFGLFGIIDIAPYKSTQRIVFIDAIFRPLNAP